MIPDSETPDSETSGAESSGAETTGSEASVESPIRVGSPFAVDPPMPLAVPPLATAGPIEPLADLGPMRYTAMGSVMASAMVVGFAVAALGWFPAGGTVIAALGCVLAIFGFYSSYRIAAAVLLAVHAGLFLANYAQSLG